MIRNFCFLLFIFSASAIAGEQNIYLDYTIRPLVENGKPALEVTLSFEGNEGGVTEVFLPSEWAGQEQLYTEITELKSLSPAVVLENTDLPEMKILHHPPRQLIKLRYQIVTRAQKEVEWYYRPVITSSYFFFFGHAAFITPNLNAQDMVHVNLSWNDFPSDWNIANSFGTHQRIQEFHQPIGTFLHSVYTGGDFQILDCGEREAQLFVAIRGEWSFSHPRLINLIQTVIESHRQFWNDFDFPYYLITVLPLGDDHYMGGTGINQAFSIFSGDLSEDCAEDWTWLAWLLSHEHFHTWNGLKMVSEEPEGSLYWFTEGFTEYYAVKLNYRSQLIDMDNYLKHFHKILLDYQASPVRNAPNARIQNEFWKSWDIQRLPYTRGFLMALRWDRHIQEISNGLFSLDDVMKTLYKRTQETRKPFSQADIEEIVSLFLPAHMVEEDLKRYIFQGETIAGSQEDFNFLWSISLETA